MCRATSEATHAVSKDGELSEGHYRIRSNLTIKQSFKYTLEVEK